MTVASTAERRPVTERPAMVAQNRQPRSEGEMLSISSGFLLLAAVVLVSSVVATASFSSMLICIPVPASVGEGSSLAYSASFSPIVEVISSTEIFLFLENLTIAGWEVQMKRCC